MLKALDGGAPRKPAPVVLRVLVSRHRQHEAVLTTEVWKRALEELPGDRAAVCYVRSNRSRFITLSQAVMKSVTNFS
jgi:hypothetical protein